MVMENSDRHAIIERSRSQFAEIAEQNGLLDTEIRVLIKTLTPEEAIGEPGRRDFPILEGVERVIEAEFLDSKAHSFTDSPGEFSGKLKEILDSPLETSRERAVYIAALNVALKHLKLIDKTIHCKDDDPEVCAVEIADHIYKKWGKIKVGLIGLNPAIAERLSETFGSENFMINDLNPEKIGKIRFGVKVSDGRTMTEDLVRRSDVVVLTGTTIVNGTFDEIYGYINRYGKEYIAYGVTFAGVSHLLGFNRLCPCGRD